MRRLIAFLFIVALVASSCGGDDDTTAGESSDSPISSTGDGGDSSDNASENNGGDTTTSSGGGGGSFCDMANDLDSGDFLGIESFTSGDLFAQAQGALQLALDNAPAAIRPDLETLFDGVTEFGGLLEKYDYKFLDADLQAELEALDTTALDEASDRVDAYLEAECGLSLSDTDTTDSMTAGDLDLGGFDLSQLEGLAENPAAAIGLLAALGVDAETSACLVAELAGLGITAEDVDNDLLSRPLCGTSLLEIMTNLQAAG